MSVSSSVLYAIISAQVGCEQSGLCDDVTLRGDSKEEEEDGEDSRALQEEIRWGRSWQWRFSVNVCGLIPNLHILIMTPRISSSPYIWHL